LCPADHGRPPPPAVSLCGFLIVHRGRVEPGGQGDCFPCDAVRVAGCAEPSIYFSWLTAALLWPRRPFRHRIFMRFL
jgi:hypothetical protein